MPVILEKTRDLSKSLRTIDQLLKILLPEITKGKEAVNANYKKEEDLNVVKNLLKQTLIRGYFDGVLKFEYNKLGKEYQGCRIGSDKRNEKFILSYAHNKK